MVCAGTPEDPCYAYLNFTANTDIYIYPSLNNSWLFSTDKKLKLLKIERKWGDGWREIKLNESCNGRWCGCYWCDKNHKAKYSYVFRKGRTYVIRFVGFKYNPHEDVKWSFGDRIDPYWYGLDYVYLNKEFPVKKKIRQINYEINKTALQIALEYCKKKYPYLEDGLLCDNMTLEDFYIEYKPVIFRFANVKLEQVNEDEWILRIRPKAKLVSEIKKCSDVSCLKNIVNELNISQKEREKLKKELAHYWSIPVNSILTNVSSFNFMHGADILIKWKPKSRIKMGYGTLVWDTEEECMINSSVTYNSETIYYDCTLNITNNAVLTLVDSVLSANTSGVSGNWDIYVEEGSTLKMNQTSDLTYTDSGTYLYLYNHGTLDFSDVLVSSYWNIYNYNFTYIESPTDYTDIAGVSNYNLFNCSNLDASGDSKNIYRLRLQGNSANYLNNCVVEGAFFLYNSNNTVYISGCDGCGGYGHAYSITGGDLNNQFIGYYNNSWYNYFDANAFYAVGAGDEREFDGYFNFSSSSFESDSTYYRNFPITARNYTNNALLPNVVVTIRNGTEVMGQNTTDSNGFTKIRVNYTSNDVYDVYINYSNIDEKVGTAYYSENTYLEGGLTFYWHEVMFSINLNSPPNQSSMSDATPDFNFTVSGSESSYSCELFINDTGYGTATANNNTATVITANQSLSDGTYDWYVNCTANSVTNQSEIREITLDTNPPTYSDKSTNTTLAGVSTEFRVKWTDNYNLTGGGFIFSWHNGTNWTKTSNSGDLESGEQSFKELTATYTFFDDFDDGDLGSNWTTYSSDATYGRIGVRTEDAHSGSYSVIADVSSNGHYNLNELITNYDFSGATSVVLTFWHKEWGDEETSGADHTDHYNSDAYYFTCDGTNWKLLGDLGDVGSTWTKVTVNITADPDWCGTADSNFKIKLTQYDNYALTYDGRGFDDINITYSASGEQEANKTPVTYSDISLDTYETMHNITISVYVSYYNNSGSQANGNTNPTLWLEVYNGTDWEDEGDFQVSGTGNYSKVITTASILNGWKTESNRDIRISARYMDYNDSTHYDRINWTGVWVEVFSEQEFLNDSFVEFNSSNCVNDTVCWSNVTKTVNSQEGATIKWKVYAKDRANNWNETPVYSYTTTSTVGQSDINYGLNSGITFRFPCDLNTGTTYGQPEGQNSTLASIWCENNGTDTGDFQVKLNQSLPTGWWLFIANSSSGTKIELNTSWQTFYWNVANGTNITNCAWFWNNCSAGAGSPHPNVEIEFMAIS